MTDYSIIVETENLSAADSDRLWGSLLSIEKSFQNYHAPQEVIVFDTGKAPPALLKAIHDRFSWLSVRQMPLGKGYYDCKMHGARSVTADIVVLADSDCLYNDDWLRSLLEPFSNPDVALVAGETAMQGAGAYALAMAISHAFDGFSNESNPSPSGGYYANNVAFRRSFLLEIPIPDYAAAYRNTCYIHSIALRHRGAVILRQPGSRALHANPENLHQFVFRFLMSGADKGVRRRCGIFDDAPKIASSYEGLLGMTSMRLRRSLANNPGQWRFLPIGLAIAGGAFALEASGLAFGYFFPDAAIRVMSRMDNVDRPTVDEVRSHHISANNSDTALGAD
jgi:hypothetical protein